MAILSQTLGLDDFFDGLKVHTCTFALSDPRVSAGETGAGDGLTADVGSELWSGTCTLVPAYHANAEAVAAKLYRLQRTGSAFMVYNPRLPGAALAGAEISAIASDRTTITIPNAAAVGVGAFFSFSYLSDPVRYALHQVVAKSGNTLEIVPRLRPGALVGTPLTFLRPACKGYIRPGSVNTGQSDRLLTTGMTFNWRQTLR
ncbi:hypothetical protein CDV50_15990 [Haematobacter massiliensis]|mgnify:CR=1 FL=1|uniref:hypothetical protein n=1 Tax=Haematobacter massiliensis TaxID=195105 RepID=UPI000B4A455D|nr:hypothetical protein [Haematobacter massiliensis]OWJ69821.1 hypothetical protein CDV50_15990 [Haematobacter massiliensis]